MFVYIHAETERHAVSVAPAGDLPEQDPLPEWLDHEGKPLTFQIVFVHGRAEVPSNIGAYLIKRGHAQARPSHRKSHP